MNVQKEKPVSIPEITLPADQYGHTGAPTEWWWHVGTLESADGRKFGFEINATGMQAYAFTQIQITDVLNQRSYQKVNPVIPCPADWAEYDLNKKWYVKLPGSQDPADGAVMMQENDNDGNPLNMKVKAGFTDAATGTVCGLELTFLQQGPPLLVWGNGSKLVNPEGKTPITRNNYYYSLTHLQASGYITIGNEKIEVSGLTWMDHEYGSFPDGSTGPVIWLLQDMQLDDGLHLSNYTEFGVLPEENVPMPSNATILKNGESIFVDTVTTPMGPTFTSSKGVVFFMKFKVEINSPQLTATFIVESSYPDQLFKDGAGADVYEGVGTCYKVSDTGEPAGYGAAWIEQNLG
jgi:predicted secreted hydrolase